MNHIISIPTDQLRNALSEEEWRRVVHSLQCSKCQMSGMWWTKIDQRYDPPGEEHYRCQNCKTIHSIKVPIKL